MWWLSDSLRNRIRFEKQMEPIGSCPVELEDEQNTEAPWESPSSTVPGMIGRPFQEASEDGENWAQRLFADDRTVVDDYHTAAVATGAQHWCRYEDCMHHAPAAGDPCPICKETRGIQSLYGPGDAA